MNTAIEFSPTSVLLRILALVTYGNQPTRPARRHVNEVLHNQSCEGALHQRRPDRSRRKGHFPLAIGDFFSAQLRPRSPYTPVSYTSALSIGFPAEFVT